MPSVSKEETDARIYDYAWHYVNTCGGSKQNAFRKMMDTRDEVSKKDYKSAGWHFHEKHKQEIERMIERFRAENRAEYPHMRDNNIAILSDIAAMGSRDSDRISAIKELDSIMGYNSTNLNLNGKVDSDIEVTITNL